MPSTGARIRKQQAPMGRWLQMAEMNGSLKKPSLLPKTPIYNLHPLSFIIYHGIIINHL